MLNGELLPDPVVVHEAQMELHHGLPQDNTTSLCNLCRFAFRRSCADRWDGEPELEITCCAPWLKSETRNTYAVTACNGFVEGSLLEAPHLTKALGLESNEVTRTHAVETALLPVTPVTSTEIPPTPSQVPAEETTPAMSVDRQSVLPAVDSVAQKAEVTPAAVSADPSSTASDTAAGRTHSATVSSTVSSSVSAILSEAEEGKPSAPEMTEDVSPAVEDIQTAPSTEDQPSAPVNPAPVVEDTEASSSDVGEE